MKTLYFELGKGSIVHEPISACIGYFDGLHKGHSKLIEEVISIAKATNSKPALITFEPDPWTVIKKVTDVPHLTPMKHRMEIGEKMGIAYWIILRFDPLMAHLSYQDFHSQVLMKLHLTTLVCGYDFHYANKGLGNTMTLKEQMDFQVCVVEEVASEHKKISSSRIETLLSEGNVEKAAEFMGRWYEMRGVVKQGNQVGREKGYPTANLKLEANYVVPRLGVYIGSVYVRKTWHPAIINIGHNPTYNYQIHPSIEAHLLSFQGMIYGEEVRFRFFKFLRDEKKFADVQALVDQLQNDESLANAYFADRKEDVLCA